MSPWQHFPFISFYHPLTVPATGLSDRTSLRLPSVAHHILPWFHCAVCGPCANIPEYQNPGIYWKYAVTLTFWPFWGPRRCGFQKHIHTLAYVCMWNVVCVRHGIDCVHVRRPVKVWCPILTPSYAFGKVSHWTWNEAGRWGSSSHTSVSIHPGTMTAGIYILSWHFPWVWGICTQLLELAQPVLLLTEPSSTWETSHLSASPAIYWFSSMVISWYYFKNWYVAYCKW